MADQNDQEDGEVIMRSTSKPILNFIADTGEKITLLSGSKSSWERLWKRYRKPLFAYAVRLLRHSAQAEDIVQETFLRAWGNRLKLRLVDDVGKWLFTVETHLIRDYIRRELRPPHLASIPDEVVDTKQSANPTLDEIVHNEGTENLIDCFSLLPQYQREAFFLRIGSEMTWSDVAGVMGYSIRHVRDLVRSSTSFLASCLGG